MIGELFGGLLVAFGLYSALPLPQIEWKRSTMRYALGFLPLIGVLVGACEYGWLLLAGKLALSSLLYAAGAVLIPVVIIWTALRTLVTRCARMETEKSGWKF